MRSTRNGVTTIVPSIIGWRTYPRALTNLLLFAVAVFGGEWLVHQVEYLIEYQSAFGTVMAATPHHYYMTPLGLLVSVVICALVIGASIELRTAHRAREALLARVPLRLARHATTLSSGEPGAPVMPTFVTLAALQALLYVVQENIESAILSRGFPGLSVLFAPQHITVIPLHLLAAACGVLLLRSLSMRVHRARNEVHVARVLATIIAAAATTPAIPPHAWLHVPSLRIPQGALGLRSPPLAV